jgi:hypothetical protein
VENLDPADTFEGLEMLRQPVAQRFILASVREEDSKWRNTHKSDLHYSNRVQLVCRAPAVSADKPAQEELGSWASLARYEVISVATRRGSAAGHAANSYDPQAAARIHKEVPLRRESILKPRDPSNNGFH